MLLHLSRFIAAAYSERSQTSKMKRFSKIVNGWKLLDVWQRSDFDSTPMFDSAS